jgi:Rieske Fe-S protein
VETNREANVGADQTVTRRRFLAVTTVGMGAAIGGVIAVPTIGYALAPVTEEATFAPVSLGPVSKFTGEQGFAPTPATYVEDAAQPLTSSGLAYVHHTGGTSHDWLAPEAMFVVFSNRCTHVGCPVAATSVGFACPCHGSVFDTRGSRIGGPAIRPLDRFQWEIRDDDALWITNRWSVLNEHDRTEYFPVKPPGQPLAGQIPALIADTAYPAVTYSASTPPQEEPGRG